MFGPVVVGSDDGSIPGCLPLAKGRASTSSEGKRARSGLAAARAARPRREGVTGAIRALYGSPPFVSSAAFLDLFPTFVDLVWQFAGQRPTRAKPGGGRRPASLGNTRNHALPVRFRRSEAFRFFGFRSGFVLGSRSWVFVFSLSLTLESVADLLVCCFQLRFANVRRS